MKIRGHELSDKEMFFGFLGLVLVLVFAYAAFDDSKREKESAENSRLLAKKENSAMKIALSKDKIKSAIGLFLDNKAMTFSAPCHRLYDSFPIINHYYVLPNQTAIKADSGESKRAFCSKYLAGNRVLGNVRSALGDKSEVNFAEQMACEESVIDSFEYTSAHRYEFYDDTCITEAKDMDYEVKYYPIIIITVKGRTRLVGGENIGSSFYSEFILNRDSTQFIQLNSATRSQEAPKKSPKAGDTKTVNGVTGVWDGKTWRRQ